MQELLLTALPDAFGLENTNNRCFFNALLQGLLSCSSFTKTLAEVPSKKEYAAAILLANILNADDPAKLNKYVHQLHALVAHHLYKKSDDRHRATMFLRGQQCSAEAYTLLMDLLEVVPAIKNLFTHRKQHIYYCTKCDSAWSIVVENTNVFILEDNAPIQEQIIRYREKLDADCTCSKCNTKGTTEKIVKLKQVPEIMFMVSKKYVSPAETNAHMPPKELFIRSAHGGSMVYTIVAQILHKGNLDGGHYWTICQRRNGWYVINDDAVTALNEPAVSKMAYITIYHYTGRRLSSSP